MVNTYFTYVPSLIVTVILGLLILWNKRKKAVNISFALLIFSLAFWITCLLVADHIHSYSVVLFWSKMAIVGPFLVPSLFLYFSTVFPDKEKTEFSWKESIMYILPLLFLIFAPTTYNVAKLTVQNYGADVTPGPLYYFLLFFLIVYLSIGLNNLRKTYRKSDGLRKLQIRYVFWGVLLTALFTVVTNIVFVILNYSEGGIWGPPSVLILIGSTTYAIVRHRLLDIRLIITRSLVYGILLTLVTLSFVFITFFSGQLFGDTGGGRAIISVIVAALIVFGLDPLKRALSIATDKIFFKAKIDYQETLRKLSEIVNTELDLTVLTERLQATLTQELKLKSSSILLLETDTGKERFVADLSKGGSDAKPFTLTSDSPLVQYLRNKKHASLIESLERKIEDTPEEKRKPLEDSKTEIERIGAALVAPVFAQDKLNAIIALGPKLSGDSFSDEDLQLIEVLSPQLGSAIQKSKLFEQVRKFGENLKIKVQEATEELRERNVSLVTLQKITTDMTQTLDFNKVSQRIADSVATELGFVGAILVFLDDDGATLRARSITNTPLTSKVMKMLPRPFSSFVTRIDDRQHWNLGQEVVSTGQIRFTESFADVISPPVPKVLVDTMQKLMRIKTFIIVPIMSEGKAIGAIEVGARRKQEEINEHEIETIKSMADQLGIVSRNIRLFNQIQKANRDLEEANKHLQVLDQAKSEFVSIASHQLRTPMTGIMGYLSMLVEGDFGKLETRHLDILRSLLDESQRMIRLINLFLNVSKIEAGKFTITKRTVHIEDLIEREVRELRKAAEDKKLKFSFIRPKKTLPELFIDDDKMQDVLLNLIDNAIKYTAKGSVIITAEEDDGGITVQVKDTGIGIKKGDIRELFSKFVRAQGIAQLHPDGSGLGLFIAKSIVEGHGGHIWVESAGEGKGSTFSFWLPIRSSGQTESTSRT